MIERSNTVILISIRAIVGMRKTNRGCDLYQAFSFYFIEWLFRHYRLAAVTQ